jgi:hypothetical protein
MLLYKDVISGDELISDAYDLELKDGIVYEANCAMVEVGGENVDIGANASAEEADEGTDDSKERVNNVVYSFKLSPTSFDKKSYMTYIKGYMKKVKAHLQETDPDAVAEFEKGAATFVKKVLANFNDYEFYTGESMNPDGMVALLNYREDGTTPYFSFCTRLFSAFASILIVSQARSQGGEALKSVSILDLYTTFVLDQIIAMPRNCSYCSCASVCGP